MARLCTTIWEGRTGGTDRVIPGFEVCNLLIYFVEVCKLLISSYKHYWSPQVCFLDTNDDQAFMVFHPTIAPSPWMFQTVLKSRISMLISSFCVPYILYFICVMGLGIGVLRMLVVRTSYVPPYATNPTGTDVRAPRPLWLLRTYTPYGRSLRVVSTLPRVRGRDGLLNNVL